MQKFILYFHLYDVNLWIVKNWMYIKMLFNKKIDLWLNLNNIKKSLLIMKDRSRLTFMENIKIFYNFRLIWCITSQKCIRTTHSEWNAGFGRRTLMFLHFNFFLIKKSFTFFCLFYFTLFKLTSLDHKVKNIYTAIKPKLYDTIYLLWLVSE